MCHSQSQHLDLKSSPRQSWHRAEALLLRPIALVHWWKVGIGKEISVLCPTQIHKESGDSMQLYFLEKYSH
jgi:hypothetical protein